MGELDYAAESPDIEDDEEEPALSLIDHSGPYHIRKGKYKGIVLPRLHGVKADYQRDKVEPLKRQIEADPDFRRHATWLAKEFAAIRIEKAKKEAELSEINLRLEAVSQFVSDQFENEDISTMTLADLGKVNVTPVIRSVVIDKEEHRQWSLKQGFERLMTLPWSTTNKHTKLLLLDGCPEPDGVVAGVTTKPKFSPLEKIKKQ